MNTASGDFSFSKKYLSGEMYFGFWKVVTKGIGLFNTFFIISSLTVYQYGVFHLLLAFYAVALAFALIGGGTVSNDIFRYIGEKKEPEAKRLFFEYCVLSLVLTILIGAIFLFGSELLSFRYEQNFIALVKILSFFLIADVLAILFNLVLRARLNFSAIASRAAIAKLFQLGILAYFFVFSEITMFKVLLSIVLSSAFSLVILLPPLVQALRPWRGVSVGKGMLLPKVFLTYGKWEIWRALFSRVTSNIQPWLIKLFISTEAVGIYNIAVQLVDFFKIFLFTNTLTTLIPQTLGNIKRTVMIFTYGIKYMSLFGMLVFGLGIIIGPIAVTILFEQYTAALPFFFFLMVSLLFHPLLMMVNTYLLVYRKQKYFFATSVVRNTFAIIMLFLLLPFIGLWGAVITNLITTVVLSYVSYRYLILKEPAFKLHPSSFFSFTERDKKLLTLLWRQLMYLVQVKFRSLHKAVRIRL